MKIATKKRLVQEYKTQTNKKYNINGTKIHLKGSTAQGLDSQRLLL